MTVISVPIDAGEHDFYCRCDVCGWVSLPTVWEPQEPRCDVCSARAEGQRNAVWLRAALAKVGVPVVGTDTPCSLTSQETTHEQY